jgi:peptidoglycan hydrolase CwlO-like protein
MARSILCASLCLVLMGLAAGCVNVDARAPEGAFWGTPAPTATIPQADPASKADLLRENQQLRERIAWLDAQVTKSTGKSRELGEDKREIQAEMAKIAAERDRYKRAAGR